VAPVPGSGSEGARPRREPFAPDFDLESLLPQNGGDGSRGFFLDGVIDRPTSLSIAGDINGDGIRDIVVYCIQGGLRGGPHRTYVVFGKTAVSPRA
jgi:hypothetical protein